MNPIWEMLEKKKSKGADGQDRMIPVATADNILTIMRNDAFFRPVRFNIMRGWPEIVKDGCRRQWTDTDDARMRTYIEKEYMISSRAKVDDAFRVFGGEREYHPVQERLNKIEWDGKKRVEQFLPFIMGAENTPYNRECSRLLFAGGVNRAFEPGCKFDTVLVFIGNQGGGKSTICRWLALEDDFFNSIKTISGQRGYESIGGKWLCEIEELLAVIANEKSGQKVEEAAKAFLSTQSDFYRKPYDHRPLDNPRHCFFLGTTNRDTFLTDRTGNRRWYPIRCTQTGAYIYDHQTEIKHYIEQCWAEMLTAYKSGDMFAAPTPMNALSDVIATQQQEAEVEDPRSGQIEEYLAGRSKVCLLQVWNECLYRDTTPPMMQRKDSLEIGEILVHKLGWRRGLVDRFGPDYGRQKAYLAPAKAENCQEYPF